jgi:hypothetical protein
VASVALPALDRGSRIDDGKAGRALLADVLVRAGLDLVAC